MDTKKSNLRYSYDFTNLIANYFLDKSKVDINELYNSLINGDQFIKIGIENLSSNFLRFGLSEFNDCFQIDLPIWNSYENGKPTVMIIGMDPKCSNNQSERSKNLIVNTPYSLHYKGGRETKRNQYWEIISKLICDYNIYTTDVYKLYFNQYNHTIKKKIPSNSIDEYISMSIHKTVLEKEINYVKPSSIICFGNSSRNVCADILGIKVTGSITHNNISNNNTFSFNDNRIKFIAIPHPSGLTRTNNWNNFFLSNGVEIPVSHTNKPSVISTLIKQSLLT